MRAEARLIQMQYGTGSSQYAGSIDSCFSVCTHTHSEHVDARAVSNTFSYVLAYFQPYVILTLPA